MAAVRIFKIQDPPGIGVCVSIPGDEVTRAIATTDDFDMVILDDMVNSDAAPSDQIQSLSHLLLLIERSA